MMNHWSDGWSILVSKNLSHASLSLLARSSLMTLPALSEKRYRYSPLRMPSSIALTNFSFLQLFWSRYSLYLQLGDCSTKAKSVKCLMYGSITPITTSLVASQLNQLSMRMAPIKLSKTSPSTFSEPIFSLENSRGEGRPLRFLLRKRNSLRVVSMSIRFIRIRSCKPKRRAMKPSVLLLTADCLRKDSVPSSFMYSPPLSYRYSTTSKSRKASPKNSNLSQNVSCFFTLIMLSIEGSLASRLRFLLSSCLAALSSREMELFSSRQSQMYSRKVGCVSAWISSPLCLKEYCSLSSSYVQQRGRSQGQGSLLANSTCREGLLRIPKAQRRVWQSLSLLFFRQKIPMIASIISACTFPGMYWYPSSSSFTPNTKMSVFMKRAFSSLLGCRRVSLTIGTGYDFFLVVKAQRKRCFLMAARCKLALQMRLALPICISPSSAVVLSRKICTVARYFSTTSPINSNSSQFSLLWCLQIFEVSDLRMSYTHRFSKMFKSTPQSSRTFWLFLENLGCSACFGSGKASKDLLKRDCWME